MVSTRQMSIINGGDYSHSNEPGSSARTTRNSGALAVCSSPPAGHNPTQLLELPQEVMEKIFGYLNFKNVCQVRLVCQKFDSYCAQILNSTFQRLQTQMLQRFQEIKAKMPRRESARRNHPLACESDIIETLHMRLTLLQMTFGKHIERKHCCFFPGDILDEVYNILTYIRVTPKLSRPYKVTDELFDLSTMAMEYFKEKIEPDLPEIAYFGADFLDFTSGAFPATTKNYLAIDSSPLGPEEGKENDRPGASDIDTEEPPQVNMVSGIRKIRQGMKRYNNLLTSLKRDLRTCRRKISEQQKQVSEQQKLISEQQKTTVECTTRMDEYDKKNEEISRKFSTLLQELNKCKTELQYWRSKSPATPPFCNACGANAAIQAQQEHLDFLNQQAAGGNGDLMADFEPVEAVELQHLEQQANININAMDNDDEDEDDDINVDNNLLNKEQQQVHANKTNNKRKLDETPISAKNSGRRGKMRSKRVKL